MIPGSKWILFSKYFAGECHEYEIQKLNKLIESRESYRKLFARLNEDNNIIVKYKEMKAVDVDKAWNNVTNRIQAAGGGKVIPMNAKIHRKSGKPIVFWAAMAATVLLIAGLFFTYQYVFKLQSNHDNFITVSKSSIDEPVLLPDGSRVYLNRDSRIVYPAVFSNTTREISLKGLAFFEVMPDPEKPFIVKADKARIKVLGTSFSVNSNTAKNLVEVYVETGKVQVYREESENENLLVEPGYVGQLSKKSQEKFLNQNENIIAWKTKKIIFFETKLFEVLKVLLDVYGEEIKCENKEALNWPYTNTFDNQNFQSVLKVLAESFQFKVKQTQNGFVLSGGIN